MTGNCHLDRGLGRVINREIQIVNDGWRSYKKSQISIGKLWLLSFMIGQFQGDLLELGNFETLYQVSEQKGKITINWAV
jgi:hypothetical protein